MCVKGTTSKNVNHVTAVCYGSACFAVYIYPVRIKYKVCKKKCNVKCQIVQVSVSYNLFFTSITHVSLFFKINVAFMIYPYLSLSLSLSVWFYLHCGDMPQNPGLWGLGEFNTISTSSHLYDVM